MIKTFRGLLADGDQATIRLSTNQGLIGYKIVKFQLIANAPGTVNYEHIVQIFSEKQDAVDGIINFDSPLLLASAYLEGGTSTTNTDNVSVIFDNRIINQDIYVTHSDVEGTNKVNYYIELEQLKLNLNEATVATLKDMRGRE